MCSFLCVCGSALPALQIGFLVTFLHAESNGPTGRNMNRAAARVKRRETALDGMPSPAASCRMRGMIDGPKAQSGLKSRNCTPRRIGRRQCGSSESLPANPRRILTIKAILGLWRSAWATAPAQNGLPRRCACSTGGIDSGGALTAVRALPLFSARKRKPSICCERRSPKGIASQSQSTGTLILNRCAITHSTRI
jgi:hypothetical protein